MIRAAGRPITGAPGNGSEGERMAGRRVELGFEGGGALRLTLPEDGVEDVAKALAGDGWVSADAEEGHFRVRADKVLYVRVAPGEVPGRVGFGGSE